MSYYITKPCCFLMCVELLISTSSTVFCFTGSSFSYYEIEDRVLGLRFNTQACGEQSLNMYLKMSVYKEDPGIKYMFLLGFNEKKLSTD